MVPAPIRDLLDKAAGPAGVVAGVLCGVEPGGVCLAKTALAGDCEGGIDDAPGLGYPERALRGDDR